MSVDTIFDVSVAINALITLVSAYYMYRVANLFRGWRYTWVYCFLFLVFAPGSRMIIGVVYATCDADWLEVTLKIVCPIIGYSCFGVYMYKMYHIFAQYLGVRRTDSQDRQRDEYRDSGRDITRDAIRDAARDKEKESGDHPSG